MSQRLCWTFDPHFLNMQKRARDAEFARLKRSTLIIGRKPKSALASRLKLRISFVGGQLYDKLSVRTSFCSP